MIYKGLYKIEDAIRRFKKHIDVYRQRTNLKIIQEKIIPENQQCIIILEYDGYITIPDLDKEIFYRERFQQKIFIDKKGIDKFRIVVHDRNYFNKHLTDVYKTPFLYGIEFYNFIPKYYNFIPNILNLPKTIKIDRCRSYDYLQYRKERDRKEKIKYIYEMG